MSGLQGSRDCGFIALYEYRYHCETESDQALNINIERLICVQRNGGGTGGENYEVYQDFRGGSLQ